MKRKECFIQNQELVNKFRTRSSKRILCLSLEGCSPSKKLKAMHGEGEAVYKAEEALLNEEEALLKEEEALP